MLENRFLEPVLDTHVPAAGLSQIQRVLGAVETEIRERVPGQRARKQTGK